MLALVASIGGCGSVRLNPDPEVAPSANVERVWAAPLSIVSANQASSKLGQLRSFDGKTAGAASAPPYDLPALADLALRINPQTRSAWYAAQAGQAQLGQSHGGDYPKVW